MIAELVAYDTGRYDDGRKERVERSHDVRSVSVRLTEDNDGKQYPRLHINTPSSARSVGMRQDGPVRLDIFDSQAHSARGSAVCGPEERWIRTVIDADLRRTIDEFVRYETLEYSTVGDVLRAALERFVDEEVSDE